MRLMQRKLRESRRQRRGFVIYERELCTVGFGGVEGGRGG